MHVNFKGGEGSTRTWWQALRNSCESTRWIPSWCSPCSITAGQRAVRRCSPTDASRCTPCLDNVVVFKLPRNPSCMRFDVRNFDLHVAKSRARGPSLFSLSTIISSFRQRCFSSCSACLYIFVMRLPLILTFSSVTFPSLALHNSFRQKKRFFSCSKRACVHWRRRGWLQNAWGRQCLARRDAGNIVHLQCTRKSSRFLENQRVQTHYCLPPFATQVSGWTQGRSCVSGEISPNNHLRDCSHVGATFSCGSGPLLLHRVDCDAVWLPARASFCTLLHIRQRGNWEASATVKRCEQPRVPAHARKQLLVDLDFNKETVTRRLLAHFGGLPSRVAFLLSKYAQNFVKHFEAVGLGCVSLRPRSAQRRATQCVFSKFSLRACVERPWERLCSTAS